MIQQAFIAQSVEHHHGKVGVISSNLIEGSISFLDPLTGRLSAAAVCRPSGEPYASPVIRLFLNSNTDKNGFSGLHFYPAAPFFFFQAIAKRGKTCIMSVMAPWSSG